MDLQISINLSPPQLKAGKEYFRAWVRHIEEFDLPASAIIFEITEGMMVDNSESTQELLRRMRLHGAQIAIDDFGTGHSSLSLLSRLDVQCLKIDQSFVQAMQSGDRDLALIEAVMAMSRTLGLRIVAEGVETAEQADRLRLMHCDYGQGYRFAPPLVAAAMEAAFTPRRTRQGQRAA